MHSTRPFGALVAFASTSRNCLTVSERWLQGSQAPRRRSVSSPVLTFSIFDLRLSLSNIGAFGKQQRYWVSVSRRLADPSGSLNI